MNGSTSRGLVRVLFVCLGNICRSPTAEGVFRDLLRREGLEGRVVVDSAGTGSWHVGEAPDARARAAALRRGIDLSGQRARQLRPADFDDFDLILAMDESNRVTIEAARPAGGAAHVRLFLDYARDAAVREVPDPYFGEGDGFETVLDLITEASEGLIAEIRQSASTGDG
jgi:protein-tyrosine phosphatase